MIFSSIHRCATITAVFLLASISAYSQPGRQPTSCVTAVNLAPFFPEPEPGLLPSGYCSKGDTGEVQQTMVDSSGGAWFLLHCKQLTLWSPAGNWRYCSYVSDETSVQRGADDTDRKRRLRILQQHRDWPRRIQSAVREGKICLDMSAEQLVASWGTPSRQCPSFAVGLGNHDVWIYADSDSVMLIVLLQEGKIIGWSTGNGIQR